MSDTNLQAIQQGYAELEQLQAEIKEHEANAQALEQKARDERATRLDKKKRAEDLSKVLGNRVVQSQIDKAQQSAAQSQAAAEQSRKEANAVLEDARKQADLLLSDAQKGANELIARLAEKEKQLDETLAKAKSAEPAPQ